MKYHQWCTEKKKEKMSLSSGPNKSGLHGYHQYSPMIQSDLGRRLTGLEFARHLKMGGTAGAPFRIPTSNNQAGHFAQHPAFFWRILVMNHQFIFLGRGDPFQFRTASRALFFILQMFQDSKLHNFMALVRALQVGFTWGYELKAINPKHLMD